MLGSLAMFWSYRSRNQHHNEPFCFVLAGGGGGGLTRSASKTGTPRCLNMDDTVDLPMPICTAGVGGPRKITSWLALEAGEWRGGVQGKEEGMHSRGRPPSWLKLF